MTPPGSLGKRLSVWLALQSLLGMAAICTAIYFDARSSLVARQIETLANKRVQIQHLLTEADGDGSWDAVKHKLDDFFIGHDEVALRLADGAANPTYTSQTLTAADQDGMSVRFTTRRPLPGSGILHATLFLDTRDDRLFLRRLGLTLISAAIGGAVLASLSGYWLVRMGLRPVRSLALQARGLAADTLYRRLSGTDQPEELAPLVEQFNDLLGRLDAAYDQLQGFNADVAHELCTPLATLISSCELALRRSRAGPELQDVVASNLEDLRRLSGIVHDMLFLSSADRGAHARRTSVSSLARIAQQVGDYHEAAMDAASVTLKISGDAAGEFDLPLLQRALSNLLLNATRYAHPGSCVNVRIQDETPAGYTRISLSDVGLQIAQRELPMIFDRFYRVDKARPGNGSHHGLGLAIVAAIARMHGGSVFASSDEDLTTVGIVLSKHASRSTCQSPGEGSEH
ncbi:heavy metal sensor histidine kinase [uncultured Aquimonas sp.]|uniref:heavy metal sensor histidine kinase n=1 Tax=uncultured Aquimonas sp. TaxID=385483 RepID=UPI002609D967|nr:heavy metal sensor histidine kinase [uncultured Aquimonas sp.]